MQDLEFTGYGWRKQGQLGCFATPDGKDPRQLSWKDSNGIDRRALVRCERILNHKGGHCCDQISWSNSC
jgi:hypothetical protein